MEEILDEERVNDNRDDYGSLYKMEKQTGAVTAALFALLVSGAMVYMGANPFVDKSKTNLQTTHLQENK